MLESTQNKIFEIKEMIYNGNSQATIARELNLSRQAVSAFIKKYDIDYKKKDSIKSIIKRNVKCTENRLIYIVEKIRKAKISGVEDVEIDYVEFAKSENYRIENKEKIKTDFIKKLGSVGKWRILDCFYRRGILFVKVECCECKKEFIKNYYTHNENVSRGFSKTCKECCYKFIKRKNKCKTEH